MKLLGKEDSRQYLAAVSIPTPTPTPPQELGFQARRIISHLGLESDRMTFSFRCSPQFNYIPTESAEREAQKPFQRKKGIKNATSRS